MTNLRDRTLRRFLSWSWHMSNAGQKRTQFYLVTQGPSLAVKEAVMLWHYYLNTWLQSLALPGKGGSRGLTLDLKLLDPKWHVSLPLSAHWPELVNDPANWKKTGIWAPPKCSWRKDKNKDTPRSLHRTFLNIMGIYQNIVAVTSGFQLYNWHNWTYFHSLKSESTINWKFYSHYPWGSPYLCWLVLWRRLLSTMMARLPSQLTV